MELQARRKLALSQLKIKNFNAAREHFSILADSEKYSPDGNIGLGIIALKYDCDYKDAKSYFEKALERSPENIHAIYYLGEALEKTGKLTKAALLFEKVLIKNPNHNAAKQKLKYLENQTNKHPRQTDPRNRKSNISLASVQSFEFSTSSFMQLLLDQGSPHEIRIYNLIKSFELDTSPSLFSHAGLLLKRVSIGIFIGLVLNAIFVNSIFVVLIFFIALIWTFIEVKSKRYVIKDGYVRYKYGILWQKEHLIELYKVRNVQLERDLFDTLLGFYTLQISIRSVPGDTDGNLFLKGFCAYQDKETLFIGIREIVTGLGLSPLVRVIVGI